MTDPVPPAQTGAHSWRYACPEGHRNLHGLAGDGYRCRTCERRYPGEPRDLKTEVREA